MCKCHSAFDRRVSRTQLRHWCYATLRITTVIIVNCSETHFNGQKTIHCWWCLDQIVSSRDLKMHCQQMRTKGNEYGSAISTGRHDHLSAAKGLFTLEVTKELLEPFEPIFSRIVMTSFSGRVTRVLNNNIRVRLLVLIFPSYL